MENALKSVGYEKPEEYFYRALQYVDGMECVNGTPYDKVSTGDLTEDDLQTEQGEESFKNRKIPQNIPFRVTVLFELRYFSSRYFFELR